MSSVFRTRIWFLGACFIVLTLVLSAKLYTVQIVNGAAYKERAERQYERPAETPFNPGSIYFTNKDGSLVSAATLKTGFILALMPKYIEDAEKTYEVLSQILEIDKDDFLKKAVKKDDPYEEIARRVPSETADEIRRAKFPGVELYSEKWRFYPANKVASDVLGIVAFKDKTLAGRYGLEKYYDDVLVRDESDLYSNFFAEIFSNVRELGKGKPLEGDLVTTIEPNVSLFLERELGKVVDTWGAKQAGGIVMDPYTGEIVSLIEHPSFDPNNFKEETTRVFGNALVEDVYEMGSIIKPLTIAAGLDSGAITAKTKYNDEGQMTIDNATISNFDGKARGTVNMQEVLNQSLNTGAVFAVNRMGKDKFRSYMKSFGLGEETGVDLPNETAGIIDNLDSPRDLEYATASFGQGIAMSPLITIRALASLANGGYLPNPHVVSKIDYKVGISRTLSYDEKRRVIKSETSEEISRMLVEVVDKALLNGTVKMTNFSIAAKTGTAQIPKVGGKGYYDDRSLHSFFGYFPAYNPRFIIFLYAVEPKARYASETLTKPFINLVKFLISYYEVAPDR